MSNGNNDTVRALQDNDSGEDLRDRTKLVWIGIAVALVAMVVAMAIVFKQTPQGTKVRARHILIAYDRSDPTDRKRALDLIEDLRQQLIDGASFSKLARQYSDDPYSAARGGDLGYSAKGDYVDTFEAYVWSAPIGELSEVITSQHGFHLIEVLDRNISEADQFEMEINRRAQETPSSQL